MDSIKYKIKKDKTNNMSDSMDKVQESQRPFSKANFYMMAGCLLLIILGFILMSGGGSGDDTFNPEIFSTRRIVVGPLFSFLGFLLMVVAIIWSPKRHK